MYSYWSIVLAKTKATIIAHTIVPSLVRLRYAVTLTRSYGTVNVYACGEVGVRLWCGRGTVVVLSRYARGAVEVRLERIMPAYCRA